MAFSVTIIKDDADPYVKITDVHASAHCMASNEPAITDVKVGDVFCISITVEYSVPADSSVVIWFRNSLGKYFFGGYPADDGWVKDAFGVHQSTTAESAIVHGIVPGAAPLNPENEWKWDIQLALYQRSEPWQQMTLASLYTCRKEVNPGERLRK